MSGVKRYYVGLGARCWHRCWAAIRVAAGDLVVHGQDSMLSCEVRTAVVQCRDFGQDFGGLDIK